MKVSTLLWAALALELGQLLVVLLLPAPPAWLPGETLPTVTMFLRACLACLVLPAAGLPLALLLLRAGPGQARVGLFSLVALSLASALVLFFVVAVVVRLFHPVTATPLALTAAATGALGLVLAGRFEGTRLGLERGLSGRVLLAGLVLVVGFGLFARVRLFGGPRRMVQVSEAERARLTDLPRLPGGLRYVSGVRRVHGIRRYVVQADRVVFALEGADAPRQVDLAFVYAAAPGSIAELHQVPGGRCGLGGGGPAPRQLARAEVPLEVLGFPIAPVIPRFNALLLGRGEVPPGGGCFELRLHPRPGPTGELVDLNGMEMDPRVLFNGWIVFGRDTEIECHVSDLAHHQETLRSNRVNPFMLLWGCFTQTVAEVLAGAHYPLLGLQFLLLAFLCFMATLVMLGAVAGETSAPRLSACGYLMLAPLLLHLHGVTYAHVASFPFPDTPYSFLLVAALALLLLRNRVGFILLGCLAAYARYPGGYVCALALLAYLAFFRDDRPWGRRTLLWALVAGLGFVALLAVHYAGTIGVGQAIRAVYFEVFPEHFQVHGHPTPLWLRLATFFAKLAALSAGTLTLWPLLRRSAAGRLLIAVTLGYALPLMGVHEPHAHYFPTLIYAAAAAGLGGLARARRFPLWAGVLVVLAGALVGLDLEDLTGIPL